MNQAFAGQAVLSSQNACNAGESRGSRSSPLGRARSAAALGILLGALDGFAAEPPKAPVPPSPFIAVVYRYADAMLQHGRDTYGPQKTGLLLSALDRTRLAPLTNRPAAPEGIRPGDRAGEANGPLLGANAQHDENLLRLLYFLSELSGKAHYREAADAELKWLLEQGASSATHLLPWGEHLSWHVLKDEPIASDGSAVGHHEFFRPWLLWDRCFTVAPQASRQFALGLWEHQMADHQTGAFDRHAGFWKHQATAGNDFPRHAGFYLRTWAAAYTHSKEAAFLRAIETLLGRFEQKRHRKTGFVEAKPGTSEAWPPSMLSLAIDCDGAAHHVAEPLASRLRAFAAREDDLFCALPHALKDRAGFITALDHATGAVGTNGFSSRWQGRYGGYTTAQIGMMCVARYDNNGKTGYRDLIVNAADAYLNSLPGDAEDPWPVTLGNAIGLQLAAWRHTARPVYLERARSLGNWAVEKFWSDNSPLPRASRKTNHYESITGADTLALALAELHLQILAITAVRCPPNTIDR